jgi:hypothetical protein
VTGWLSATLAAQKRFPLMRNRFAILALATALTGVFAADLPAAESKKKRRPVVTPEVLSANQQAQKAILLMKLRAMRERQAASRPLGQMKRPVQQPRRLR